MSRDRFTERGAFVTRLPPTPVAPIASGIPMKGKPSGLEAMVGPKRVSSRAIRAKDGFRQHPATDVDGAMALCSATLTNRK